MEMVYNGVALELLHLDRVERTNVYTPDNTDLLYVKWVIGATCVYGSNGGTPVGTASKFLSPSTSTEVYSGDPPAPTIRGTDPKFGTVTQDTNTALNRPAVPSLNAALSDAELRNYLWQPRQKLILRAYDDTGKPAIWLESPRLGKTVDAANGPLPLSVDVISATGDGHTFGVNVQIQTCLPPCPLGSDRLVLSHRWQMTHTQDDDYYLTRVIQGEVVFNSEETVRLAQSPDWFRNQFFHPIPLGFQRKLGPISLSADGLVLKYEYSDTDPTVVFEPGDTGCTSIEIVEKVAYNQPWRVLSGGKIPGDRTGFWGGVKRGLEWWYEQPLWQWK